MFQILNESCVAQVKDEVKIQTICGHHPFIIDSPQYWQDRGRLYIGDVTVYIFFHLESLFIFFKDSKVVPSFQFKEIYV